MRSPLQKRNSQLGDVQLVPLPGIGPAKCNAIVTLLWDRKVENHNTTAIEYLSMVRNKDVMSCGVGMLGLYFLFMYDVHGRYLPDFSSTEWQNECVFIKSK